MIDKKNAWRFIDTGIHDGFMNMAIEEAMLEVHILGRTPPTLRVYRWNPPALSIGYLQRIEDDIDCKKCSGLGIDVVRRLTGGRGVLHSDEMTYSVVASGRYGLPEAVLESYRLLNEGLIAAYKILGLDVSLVSSERGLSSAACFAAAATADLTYKGRKIAGSAQFRRGKALLQHGSLPVSLDAELCHAVIKYPEADIRKKALSVFRKKATDIKTALGKRVGWQELADALFEGFQHSLGIELYRDSLTSEEIELSHRLAEEKYRTAAWNDFGVYNAE